MRQPFRRQWETLISGLTWRRLTELFIYLGIYFDILGLDKVESLPQEFAEISRESLRSMQDEKEHIEHEKWYQIMFQVSVPFFIAGIGTIGAGLVMAMVTVSNKN